MKTSPFCCSWDYLPELAKQNPPRKIGRNQNDFGCRYSNSESAKFGENSEFLQGRDISRNNWVQCKFQYAAMYRAAIAATIHRPSDGSSAKPLAIVYGSATAFAPVSGGTDLFISGCSMAEESTPVFEQNVQVGCVVSTFFPASQCSLIHISAKCSAKTFDGRKFYSKCPR